MTEEIESHIESCWLESTCVLGLYGKLLMAAGVASMSTVQHCLMSDQSQLPLLQKRPAAGQS